MVCTICILCIVYIFGILCIIFIYAASLAVAFHAQIAKYLHLVQAGQRQSKTQLLLSMTHHQRDGTNCSHQRHHQHDFLEILSIICMFCIICIYCIMCTSSQYMYRKDHPSRRSVLLFAAGLTMATNIMKKLMPDAELHRISLS